MSRERRTLVLFPGALGDLLCCWPALSSLVTAGDLVTLCARPEWSAVLPSDALAGRVSIDRREIAELFAAGPMTSAPATLLGGQDRVVSFTGAHDANFAARLAHAVGLAPTLHPLRGMVHGEHASAYFARCLETDPRGESLPVATDALAWADAFWRNHALGSRVLVVHAGSGAPRKTWEGASAAAAAWLRDGGQVVALSGPAELERPTPLDATARMHGEPLPRVAAVLLRGTRYLGNDSGITHLAGLVGARGVAVFGATDPSTWRPLGAGITVLHAPAPCARCGRDRLCTHRVAIDAVLAAVTRA